MCHVKTRRKKKIYFKTNFRIGTKKLDLVRTSSFYISVLAFRAYGTFKLFVCFSFRRRDILLTEVPCIIIRLGKSFPTRSSATSLPSCTSARPNTPNIGGLRLEPNPPKAKVFHGVLGKTFSDIALYASVSNCVFGQ